MVWQEDYQNLKAMMSGESASVRSSSAEGESPSSSSAQTTRDEPDTKAPRWAKTLYRQIAMITHPDRLFDPADVKSMTSLFNRASKSIKSGNFDDLVDVAIELGIDVDLPDEDVTKRIESKLENIENRIFSMENCVAWKWCEAENSTEKVVIAKQALNYEAYCVPEDDELKKLIELLN